jgi:hypothetical protein
VAEEIPFLAPVKSNELGGGAGVLYDHAHGGTVCVTLSTLSPVRLLHGAIL